LSYPVLIGGAAINRAFSYRALYPGGGDSEEVYEPGVFYCKDAFEGLAVMDKLIDASAREGLVAKLQSGAREFREKPVEVQQGPPTSDDSVRSAARTDVPVPTPPFWGAREIPVDLDEVYHHLDTHVLFKLHWGGRGKKGEEWRALVREDFRPRLERMWREQDYLHPRTLLGFFPCYALGNEIVVLDPQEHGRELTRFVCPRQSAGERICLADFFRPAHEGGPPAQLDVVALQAVTVGGEVSELLSRLEADGEYAEQLFVHGLSVQSAEALAEWLHSEVRRMLGIPATQGRRYSWGYPAVPEQSEHLKVDKLLELSRIGLTITDGYAPDPEQSTLALIAHHPQAIYFGTRQGRLPRGEGSPDDVIRGSSRDPALLSELDDSDPPGTQREDEDEPAMAG
jgi:5-methyltetrahydrofolate--homocysteine methyltransferase